MPDGATPSSQVQDTTDTSSPAIAHSPSAVDAGPRTVVERPPPGLQRGKYAWPAWGIGSLGGLIVLAGLGYLVWRLWRRRSKVDLP